ncbi:hypothetical protein ACF0H5_009398 [Mactra antiquata]
MTSRKCSISPNRSKIPDVFVIQDFSNSPPTTSGVQGHLSPTYTGYLSPDCNSSIYTRSNSTVSSIFDLSFESEQLDRALRNNDTFAVTKFLQVHYGKFPINFRCSSPCGDKYSTESRSRHPSSRSQEPDIFGRTKHPNYFDRIDFDRRESVTPECDIPDIFRTSLHVAILHNSLGVMEVLLKHGIDPNEPKANLINSERRLSSFISDNNRLRPNCVIEESHETSNSEDSLTSRSMDNLTLSVPTPLQIATVHSVDSSPLPNNKNNNNTSNCDNKPKATFAISLDHEITYTQEELFNLPPIFLAIQEKREVAVCHLLYHGADVNVRDKIGNTPLHVASTENCYSSDICTVLLRHGAKIKTQNDHGLTALEIRESLYELQTVVIKDMLSSKGSVYSLENILEGSKKGKRISLSSSADSGSKATSRSGSIKKRFFKRSELKEMEKAVKERRKLESTTGTVLL